MGDSTYPRMNRLVPSVMTSVLTPNSSAVYGMADEKMEDANVLHTEESNEVRPCLATSAGRC